MCVLQETCHARLAVALAKRAGRQVSPFSRNDNVGAGKGVGESGASRPIPLPQKTTHGGVISTKTHCEAVCRRETCLAGKAGIYSPLSPPLIQPLSGHFDRAKSAHRRMAVRLG